MHGRKVVRCVQFYWTRGYFSKPNATCNKTLRLVLEYIKNCRSGVSFVAVAVVIPDAQNFSTNMQALSIKYLDIRRSSLSYVDLSPLVFANFVDYGSSRFLHIPDIILIAS